MSLKDIEIEIYNPIEGFSETIAIKTLSENTYKALENSIFSDDLVFGTEFETLINEKGQHEIVKILKVSEYITRRFILGSEFKESEYRVLGDEIMKIGGFWQVDMGSIATINIPKDQESYVSNIFEIFNLKYTE